MSENSSITVDQPLPRNTDLQRQNGVGRGVQMVPMANLRPPPPPIARRILVIQNQSDIVNVLSTIARINRQAIYILSGRGLVSHASLLSLPSREQLLFIGLGNILYLSGWFQHMVAIQRIGIPANGILHVSLSNGLQRVAIGTSLIASGTVEVDVMFVCGQGSAFPPDPPGGPRGPIRVQVNVFGAQAPPVANVLRPPQAPPMTN